MPYDFDAEHDRRGTDSLKWDVGADELPMWVADMDFATAPVVQEAVQRRAASGIYGYATVPDRWYDAIRNRWQRAHGFCIEKEWLCFCTGVIPAVTSLVKRLTNVGDNVVLLTPVYDIFFHSVENTGRHVSESKLSYKGGAYEIDFADLEQKLSDPLTTLFILCNPHNPVGKVWSKAELAEMGRLCKKHGVLVLSDEIHCDLTDEGHAYVPFASASRDCRARSVSCISASKAFNLAGLQSAAVFVPDETLRNVVVRALNSDEAAEPNCFAVDATVAAFARGDDWLDGLRAYLCENKRTAAAFLQEHLPALHLVEGHATYLLWIDVSAVSRDARVLRDFLRERTGLYLSAGNVYRGNGDSFLRMNVACPRTRLRDGLSRLQRGVEAFAKQ